MRASLARKGVCGGGEDCAVGVGACEEYDGGGVAGVAASLLLACGLWMDGWVGEWVRLRPPGWAPGRHLHEPRYERIAPWRWGLLHAGAKLCLAGAC